MADRTEVEAGGETAAGLNRDQLIELYRWLRLTRDVEQALTNLYRQNKVIGGLYCSLGQEAEAVGTAYALTRRDDGTGDVLSPAIRNLGSLLVMGADPVDVMRQYMAKGDSPSGGREQNLHLFDFDKGYIGLISHLGVMIEVMCGVALSFKFREQDRVAMVYAGDGMTSTGAFHEGLNFAAVQRAPLVVVVENNRYAYSTPVEKQTAARSFVDKAPGYGIRGERCDGNDLLAVYELARELVAHARAGQGPALLEVMTYRLKGHAEHDAQAYLPDGELAEWEARDPVDAYRRRVLEADWAAESDLDTIDAEVRAEVDATRDAAEASGMPKPEGALHPVFGDRDVAPPWTRLSVPDPHHA
ncbi:MAG: thiamine pyrophosphate-dependent dehydrogenase E1 component subunit alpha [Longimicrobiales bacterium]